MLNEKYNTLDLFDEFGDLNYEISDLAYKLANQENIGITNDRDLFLALSDKDGELVAAAWTSYDNDNFEWDVVVDKKHQGKGLGSYLIDKCIDEYSNYLDINPLCTMDITVVNDIMRKALKKRGFSKEKLISQGFYKLSMPKKTEIFLNNYTKEPEKASNNYKLK